MNLYTHSKNDIHLNKTPPPKKGERAQLIIEKYSNSKHQKDTYAAIKSSYMVHSTGTQTIQKNRHRRRRHSHDNMRDMKVNEIEIVESLEEPQPYPRRTAKSNIIPTETVNSAYGEYMSDALGNFIFLPKTAKFDFKVKQADWSGGNDLLAARKLPTVSAVSRSDNADAMWETYEFVDHSKSSRRSRRPKSEKRRTRVVKYEADSTGQGIFSQSVPIVSVSGGRKKVSLVLNDERKKRVETTTDTSLYDKFPHVNSYGQTKVPQRHVDVSLMNDRVKKQTNFRGPYGLSSADYLRKNQFVENFEHQ